MTLFKWSARAVAIVMACLNVAAEVTCLIVLFRREGDTVSSVIIWVGVGCSLAWVLRLLIAYILGEEPEQGQEEPEQGQEEPEQGQEEPEQGQEE
jgi:hypothetical protein